MPLSMNWPMAGGGDQVRMRIDTRSGRTASLNSQGVWALHRLFDKARIVPGSSPEVFTAHYNLDGYALALEVRANSIYNPFRLTALRNFSCPG
ncbi:hypothetical protein D3C76_968520 [compost metagenome]